MLSNIQTVKDVKTAVLTADHINKHFGFEDYWLHIYSAQDREPAYTMTILQIGLHRNLTGKVVLAGFGNLRKVLKDAWLFVNSSSSEEVPLALGEAALAGIPIVSTEVEETSFVLTDLDNKSRKFGEAVPPNDSMTYWPSLVLRSMC
jgi:glycosyltransferase involved in cell wall biosynthesis